MAVTSTQTDLAAQLAAKAAQIPSLRAVRLQADYVPARLPSGKVTGIWGEALIRTPDGDLRELVVGDEIRKGDVIMTTQNGIVQLDEEGSRLARIPDALEQILTDLPPPGAGLPGVDPGSLLPGVRVERLNEGTLGSAYAFDAASREAGAAFVAAFGDAALPAVLISSPTVNESSGTAVFTLTLTAPNAQGVTVGLTTQDGSATGGGVDYGSTTPNNIEVSTDGGGTWTPATSVTLPPGTTTALVRVPINGNETIDEPNETFTLTATTPNVGGGTSTSVGTATIVDDDATPQVTSVTPRGTDVNGDGIVDVIEGTGTANTLTFDVTLSNASSQALTYTLVLAGNGGNPVDRASDLGTLSVSGNVTLGANGTTVTVPAGQTSFTVSLLTNPDRLDEQNEGLSLTVGGVAGTAEVIDDDSAPTATSSTINAVEEGGLVAVVPTLPQDVDGDALTVVVTSLPTIGRIGLTAGNPATLATVVVVGQSLTLSELAALRYEPPADYNGTDPVGSFGYTVSDGVNSTAATTTIALAPVNDAPTTLPVTLAAVSEDPATPRLITQAELLVNATDVDGPNLSATNLQLASGTGTLVDNGDGTWNFTPTANDDSAVTFSYTINDNAPANPKTVAGSASLDITPVNDGPTNADVVLAPISEDPALPRVITQAELLVNARDIDGPNLTATGLQIASGRGTLVDNGNGTWNYTPARDDDTAVSFTYTVTDNAPGAPLTVPGRATLDILPVDDPPTNTLPTSAAGLTTAEDTPLVFSAATNNAIVVGDVDTSSVRTVISVALPAGAPAGAEAGTLTLANAAPAGVTVNVLSPGSLELIGSGAAITAALDGLTFRNFPDFYTRGNNGADIDIPGVTLKVETTDSVNTPPTTSTADIAIRAVVDIQISVDVTDEGVATSPFSLADFRGGSATLGFENPNAQIIAINGQLIVPGSEVIAEGGKVSMNANREIFYTPDPLFTTSTTDPAAYTFTVSSGGREEVVVRFVQVNPISTLTGIADSSDVFAWQLGDQGIAGAPRNYTVIGFDPASATLPSKGDVLDLRDLLQGENASIAGNIDSYLDFAKVGADTKISIHSTGNPAVIDQTITLNNVDLVTGFGNDAAIINNLIAQNKLLVDSV